MSLRAILLQNSLSSKFEVGQCISVPKTYFQKSELPQDKQNLYDEITHFTGTIITKCVNTARVKFDIDGKYGSVAYEHLAVLESNEQPEVANLSDILPVEPPVETSESDDEVPIDKQSSQCSDKKKKLVKKKRSQNKRQEMKDKARKHVTQLAGDTSNCITTSVLKQKLQKLRNNPPSKHADCSSFFQDTTEKSKKPPRNKRKQRILQIKIAKKQSEASPRVCSVQRCSEPVSIPESESVPEPVVVETVTEPIDIESDDGFAADDPEVINRHVLQNMEEAADKDDVSLTLENMYGGVHYGLSIDEWKKKSDAEKKTIKVNAQRKVWKPFGFFSDLGSAINPNGFQTFL